MFLILSIRAICSKQARWSYGANRVQVEADVKVLSEFLTYLQTDSVRGPPSISSLAPARLASAGRSSTSPFCDQMSITHGQLAYAERMRELNVPLRLLIENEISRLCVWRNPASDPKRGADLSGNIEKTLTDVS